MKRPATTAQRLARGYETVRQLLLENAALKRRIAALERQSACADLDAAARHVAESFTTQENKR